MAYYPDGLDQDLRKGVKSEVYEYDKDSERGEGNDQKTPRYALKKGLSPRHIQLIALGAMIGTGLFVSTSSTLATCGPAGLFTGYLIMSIVLYPIMDSLAEMVCFLPDSQLGPGGSVSRIVKRYVDPSLGFATGWNYYYCFIIMLASEYTAASGVVAYWTDAVPKGVWITIFILIVSALNFVAVKWYGEAEFWFAIIKILTIVGLIILSFVLFWGGGPNHDQLGFRFWKKPGAFAYHITDGSTGRFLDIWTAIIKGSFSFVLGPEMIATTSSEAVNPRRTIGKASKRFVYRVFIFYVLSALSISCIVAYNDKALNLALKQNKPGAGSSPFVIAIQNAGIKGLPHVINACVLTSACSSANAFLFLSSRSLLSLVQDGAAPKFLGRINKMGVPYTAVGFSMLLGCLAYLNVSDSSANVFAWFSNVSTISGFIGWIMIGVSSLRFRKAIALQGLQDRLPYKAKFQPYATYFYLVFITVVCLTNGYATFIPKIWNAKDFVAAYITFPAFLLLWLGHKIYTKSYTHWAYRVDEIDVVTGMVEAEQEDADNNNRSITCNTKWEKFLDWIY